MDYTKILDYGSWIGEKLAVPTQFCIKKLAEFGVTISPLGAKIVNLLLILGILYLFIKVISIAKKPIKYLIIFLLIILGLSTITSLI